MKNHNESGSKVHTFIHLKEHMGNNTINSVKETIKQGTITQKEATKIFVNGKDTVSVANVNKLKGHRSSTFHGIKISTGWTEATVTTKRNKFEFAALGAGK